VVVTPAVSDLRACSEKQLTATIKTGNGGPRRALRTPCQKLRVIHPLMRNREDAEVHSQRRNIELKENAADRIP
jgi:hypothetical protein